MIKKTICQAKKHPRGVAALLFGVMLPVFIGVASLSVDTSMIAVGRCQLSTAADSAALAGAQALAKLNLYGGYTNSNLQYSVSNNKAIALAHANPVLGAVPVVNSNLSNAVDGQVVVGYMDPTKSNSTFDSSATLSTKFNSVQVTLYRDRSHGGPVPTFFGQLMGFKGANLTVTSTATAANYAYAGFKAKGSLCAQMLPIVLDKPTWQAMLAGSTTDQYTYDATTRAVTSGADGVTESQLYPVKNGSPGNWGTINVGVTNNSTSTLGAQIRYGITPAQLATFPNSTIQLDNSLSPPSITFSGNPGISAGIKDDLTSIIGKPVAIPIYDQNGGNGNNAWYRVIYFQPAVITSVNFQGNPKYVIIQPTVLDDDTGVPGTLQSWSQAGLVELHLSR